MQYGRRVTRLKSLLGRHGLDLLIVLAATEAALEVALRSGDKAPTTTLWFAAPAAAALVLTLLGRRRWPFGAPAALWLLAAALSFVDGRLVTFPFAVQLAGLAAAFLLGNVRDERQSRVGLARRGRVRGDRDRQRSEPLGDRAVPDDGPVRARLVRRLRAA